MDRYDDFTNYTYPDLRFIATGPAYNTLGVKSGTLIETGNAEVVIQTIDIICNDDSSKYLSFFDVDETELLRIYTKGVCDDRFQVDIKLEENSGLYCRAANAANYSVCIGISISKCIVFYKDLKEV